MKLQEKILSLLGLVIVCGFGYSIDMPQALQAPLRQQPYSLTSLQINLLYFSSFIPVLITDIPIGIILDKYPLQRSVLVIAFSSFLSSIITAMLFDFRPQGYLVGVYLMRAVGGMAGSSAFTMQGFLIARYASQNYEMLMGFGMTIPFIFDSINVTITPYIFDSTKSMSLPWYIASIVDSFALVAAISIAVMVSKRQKRVKDSLIQSGSAAQQVEEQQFKANYILTLPKIFWILLATIFVYEMSTLIFQNLNQLIVNRFRIPYTTTANLLLMPYFLGAIFSLIFGKLVGTKIKKIRRKIILLCPLLLLIGVVALYFLPNNQSEADITSFDYFIIVFFLIQLSLMVGSIFSVISSSLSLLVDQRRLGTAWGVCGMAIGLSESIVPIVNGLIQSENDLPNSYKNLTLAFIFILSIGLAFGIYVYLGPFQRIDLTFHQLTQQNRILEQSKEANPSQIMSSADIDQ